MMIVFLRIAYRESITVLLGTVMLLSCKNDIQQVKQVMEEEDRPEMTGDHLVLIYSDSARIQYKASAPQFLKVTKGSEKYEEYPKGILVISYDKEGKELGSITAKYAKKLEDEMLWEARDEVVIVNAEGKKLETEQLFWDMKKKIIYSDRYSRLSDKGQILEGNGGFVSDQNLEHPVFKRTTGRVEVEKQQQKE